MQVPQRAPFTGPNERSDGRQLPSWFLASAPSSAISFTPPRNTPVDMHRSNSARSVSYTPAPGVRSQPRGVHGNPHSTSRGAARPPLPRERRSRSPCAVPQFMMSQGRSPPRCASVTSLSRSSEPMAAGSPPAWVSFTAPGHHMVPAATPAVPSVASHAAPPAVIAVPTPVRAHGSRRAVSPTHASPCALRWTAPSPGSSPRPFGISTVGVVGLLNGTTSSCSVSREHAGHASPSVKERRVHTTRGGRREESLGTKSLRVHAAVAALAVASAPGSRGPSPIRVRGEALAHAAGGA